jgi:hypothetical protein|tara:strand:- start:1346 stop:1774 length:429 start_codon:yes stop_codon:yes gene_type:complete
MVGLLLVIIETKAHRKEYTMSNITDLFVSRIIEKAEKGFIEKNLPSHMWGGAKRYLKEGTSPGNFLTNILENDFMQAIAHADGSNSLCITAWAKWVYNDIPLDCHGNYQIVNDHIMAGGYQGIHSENAINTEHQNDWYRKTQ